MWEKEASMTIMPTPKNIRIFSAPSHLELVDQKVYRCYPTLNQKMVVDPNSLPYYSYAASNFVFQGYRDQSSSVLVDLDGKYYRYFLNNKGKVCSAEMADSLPPANCPYTTGEWYELPERLKQEYVSDNYSHFNLEDQEIMITGVDPDEESGGNKHWYTNFNLSTCEY